MRLFLLAEEVALECSPTRPRVGVARGRALGLSLKINPNEDNHTKARGNLVEGAQLLPPNEILEDELLPPEFRL